MSDDGLVARVRAGDDRAFEELYARYHRRIAAYVRGLARDAGRAEDITQDVFISALRRIRATDRPIAFKPWIYEIARNACIDAFRRTRGAETVPLVVGEGASPEVAALAAPGPSTEGAVVAKEQLEHLRGAFDELSDSHHEILVMRELEGRSYREIGDRLGMSRPSVESTLFRARRRLHQEYDDLESGARCERMLAVVEAARERRLRGRELRGLATHAAHCGDCRRSALAAGIDPALLERKPRRRRIADKLAGLLPFPWLWRRESRGGGSDGMGMAVAQAAATPGADQAVSAWGKAMAAAVAVLVAGTGAGMVASDRSSLPDPASGARERQAVVAGGGGGGPAAPAAPGARSGPTREARSGGRQARDPGARAERRDRAASGGTRGAGGETRPASGSPVADGGGSAPAGAGAGAGGEGGAAPGRGDGGRSGGGSGDSGASTPAAPDVREVVRDPGGAVEDTAGAVEQTAGQVGDVVEQTTDAAGGAAGEAGGAVDEAAGAVGNVVEEVTGAAGEAAESVPVPPPPPVVEDTVDSVTGGALP